MTSNCPSCRMPAMSGAVKCSFCGKPLAVMAPNQQFNSSSTNFVPNQSAHLPQSLREVITSYVLESILMIVTFGVGGLIWSLVLANSGQTPASKIRDDVFIQLKTNRKAPAWKLILRQLLVFAFLTYVLLGLIFGFGVIIDVGGYIFATRVIPGIFIGLAFLDFILIFTPIRRRLIDWIFAIKAVDGNGYSFRNYTSPQGF